LNQSVPFAVGPSYLSHAQVDLPIKEKNVNSTQTKTVVFVPNNTTEACGTEDPRIAVLDGLYYLFYTAYNCTNAMLSFATTEDPSDPDGWTRHGYVFPEKNWSKSAAALFATKENGLSKNYIFWGDSSTPVNGIGIAYSEDGLTWNDTGDLLIEIREELFDSGLVESGPAPLQLSTGDFLFIYNSARHGYPSVKPAWDLQYNIGFTILNKTDPTVVVQRSDEPIMSPVYDWEIGNTTDYLTPNVVFLEGLVVDPNGCPSNVAELSEAPEGANFECFFGVYGGADSDVGSVRIVVASFNVPDDELTVAEKDEFISEFF